MMDLCGKSALITGGSSGIGLAIAAEFLASGVRNILLVDVNPPESEVINDWREKFPKSRIEIHLADVGQMKEVRKAFTVFDHLDIVVNSAGIFDECDYEKMFRINVCGVINSCLLAIEHMRMDRGGGGGCVVNIASIAALEPVLAAPLYSATKQSVLTITSSLAHDFFFRRFGIQFHTLCPGATRTRFFIDSFDARCLFPEFVEDYRRKMKEYPVQEVESVARAAIEVIRQQKNGSVMVINDGEITEH
ncbi:alcohol dehydrogenase 1 [Sergentomyia squamirostris]